jgi:hypothetical protein
VTVVLLNSPLVGPLTWRAVAALLGDAVAPDQLRPVPLGFCTDPMPAAVWSGPAGYLLLSEGYRDAAEEARRAGYDVRESIDHHLAMLTAPERVAEALRPLVR